LQSSPFDGLADTAGGHIVRAVAAVLTSLAGHAPALSPQGTPTAPGRASASLIWENSTTQVF
jgi:hypothetical protein